MSLAALGALSVLFASLGLILRTSQSKLSAAVPLFGGLFLIGAALLRYEEPIVFFASLISEGDFADVFSVVLRMLGIGMLCTVAADACRDLGEESMASRVEMCARAEILLLSLPFLRELFLLFGEVTA